MPERRNPEPKRGAGRSGRALFLLTFFKAFVKKVSRRKGETLSRRYLNNGYVHSQQKTSTQ
ncbi:hypothetical protein, partial [Pseudomonas sp. GM49]|uniref:hypothetical protein n=1 Tax=Pseudomonas sp. GM49 TaxID=1144331 RepID=UPI001EE6394F